MWLYVHRLSRRMTSYLYLRLAQVQMLFTTSSDQSFVANTKVTDSGLMSSDVQMDKRQREHRHH